jgi:hypothetical protein
MGFDPSRLRRGELLAGACAVLLAVFLFGLHWYAGAGRTGGSLTGWQGLTNVRWLLLVTILCALALFVLQATRRAPAIPVTMSMVVMLIGLLSVVVLGWRVLLSAPAGQQAGAYLALAATLGIAIGGSLSFRQEGISPRDAPTDIPLVRPGGGHRSGHRS